MAYEIFQGDKIRRWRCMDCNRIFAEPEYREVNGELIKLREIVRGKQRDG